MLVYMATRPSSQLDLAMTAVIAIAVVVVGVLITRRGARDSAAEPPVHSDAGG
jgi:GABA permease